MGSKFCRAIYGQKNSLQPCSLLRFRVKGVADGAARTRGLIAHVPLPSRAGPNRAEPSRAEPSRTVRLVRGGERESVRKAYLSVYFDYIFTRVLISTVANFPSHVIPISLNYAKLSGATTERGVMIKTNDCHLMPCLFFCGGNPHKTKASGKVTFG